MSIISIVGIILVSVLLIISLSWFIIHQNNVANGNAPKKKKCLVTACNMWLKNEEIKNKFCDFHYEMNLLKQKLELLKNPLSNKALFYLGVDAKQFQSNKNKIIDNLKEKAL